jgi:cobalamin biosynthesis protein CbiD
MLIINNPGLVFPTAAAAAKAVAALDDGEDYKFIVVSDPSGSGKAIIKVYDIETGDFIANV